MEEAKEDDDWKVGELNLKRDIRIRVKQGVLVLQQDSKSTQCGAVVWEVSVIVARLLAESAIASCCEVAGRRVLELGAGCGLAGMAFALHGAHVTFTDLPELIPHLESNVERNLGKLTNWSIAAYDWSSPLPSKLQSRFDIVLATDCVYHAHLVQPFLDALKAVCTTTSTLLLVYERRDAQVISDFEIQLRRSFKCKKPLSTKKLRSILGDEILLREDDAEWLTILECRRRKSDMKLQIPPDTMKDEEAKMRIEAIDIL